jgi:ATP-binding cassette, subfamily C (CFTR/MRP), member 1
MIVVIYVRMVQTSTVRWWPTQQCTSRSYWMKQVRRGAPHCYRVSKMTNCKQQGVYSIHLLLGTLLMILRRRAQITATASHPCVQTGMSFVSDLTSTVTASLLILNTSLEMATTSWSTAPRPFAAYLTVGLLSDLLRARTLDHVCAADRTLGPGFVALGSLKGLSAVLELSRPPRGPENCTAAEDNAGLLSRLGFGWLYGTIRRGYSTRLQIKDLPLTKQGIRIASSQSGLEESILEKDCSAAPLSRSQYTLHRKILKSFSLSIATPILLRLLLLVVQLAQPIIIRATLKFAETVPEQSRGHGGFIILGVVAIYVGAALISGAYWHAVNSDVTRLRGILFNAIFKRALVTEETQEDGGTGTMVSLLSSDVDAVLQGFLWIHELWATPITAAVSMWMLYREVGLA